MKLNWAITTISLLLLLLKSGISVSESAPDFVMHENSKPEFIGNYTQYFADEGGTLKFDKIFEEQHLFEWKVAPKKGITKGFNSPPYWLQFTIRNDAKTKQKWNIEFGYPLLDSIDFYSPTIDTPNRYQAYEVSHYGDEFSFSQRDIQYRNIIIPIRMEPGSRKTFYVRIATKSSMNVPIKLWPKNSLYTEIDRVKMFLGLIYGLVILALLSTLMNSFFLKDTMYLWLCLAFMGQLLYLSGIKGITYQYFWPESTWWAAINIPFFMNLSYAPVLQYCRIFTGLKRHWPMLDKLCLFFIYVSVFAALCCTVLDYGIMIRYSTVTAILLGLLSLICGGLSWAQGNTSARLYVLAWSIFFIGSVSFALTALGALPRNLLTTWAQEIGFIWFVVLMTIAQFDRFLQRQHKHKDEQSASLSALKDAEIKYRSLFENAIEGIFQLDASGNVTNTNTAFKEIIAKHGQANKVIESSPYSLGFLELDRSEDLRSQLQSSNRISEFETTFKDANGTQHWVSISIRKIAKSSTDSVHFEGSIDDITESKKREQAEKESRMAEASTEAKSMFLANMSHEIRTPMNSIIGFTDLATSTNTDEKMAGFLKKIKMASSSLLGIINDILDFSKMEAGKLNIESIPFYVSDLCDNLSNIVAGNVEAKGLSFSIKVDKDIPNQLIGDPLRLNQILVNLTNNAVKFTSEGEVKVELILVELNKKSGNIEIEVKVTDTGIGISETQQKSLFSSFVQADESTTRNFGGTGLGLSISKQLVELMGGTISISSTEGKGSCFKFNVSARLESRKQASSNASSRSLNVLIIDDSEDSMQLLESVVLSLKHNAICEPSVEKAISLLRSNNHASNPIDVILVDWLMPEMNGLEFMAQIVKDKNINPPISILVSSYSEQGLVQKALDAGFHSFIEKPISKQALTRELATMFPENDVLLDKGTPNQPVKELYSFDGLKVLLVEDVVMNQELAKEILTKQGMLVSLANNGKEGVEKADRGKFDLILMDMQMPIMDGCSATEAIRHFDQDIPIIAMTANAMTEDRQMCFASGMDDFITKPIDDNALFSVILKHVKGIEKKN